MVISRLFGQSGSPSVAMAPPSADHPNGMRRSPQAFGTARPVTAAAAHAHREAARTPGLRVGSDSACRCGGPACCHTTAGTICWPWLLQAPLRNRGAKRQTHTNSRWLGPALLRGNPSDGLICRLTNEGRVLPMTPKSVRPRCPDAGGSGQNDHDQWMRRLQSATAALSPDSLRIAE